MRWRRRRKRRGARARPSSSLAEGRTYEQIARAVGYANRGTAHRVVAKALTERLANDIDVLRVMEMDRLDAILAAH